MGQTPIKENTFWIAIHDGLQNDNISFSYNKIYKDVNYGIIIKPLNIPDNFKFPLMLYFHGVPYHVGLVRSTDCNSADLVYSFCPDLRDPHRGTLIKDIKIETLRSWYKESDKTIVFWLPDKELINTNLYNFTEYDLITSRLIDIMSVENQSLLLDEFNRRYNTTLQYKYNLFANNCEDFLLSILFGKTKSYQIDSVKHIIISFMDNTTVINKLPNYVKMWIQDFKTLKLKS